MSKTVDDKKYVFQIDDKYLKRLPYIFQVFVPFKLEVPK